MIIAMFNRVFTVIIKIEKIYYFLAKYLNTRSRCKKHLVMWDDKGNDENAIWLAHSIFIRIHKNVKKQVLDGSYLCHKYFS